jgi:hypothetical protein
LQSQGEKKAGQKHWRLMMNMRSHPCFVSLSYSIFLFFFFAFYYTMRLLTLPSPQHPQLELSEKHTRVVSKISLSATTNRRCGY